MDRIPIDQEVGLYKAIIGNLIMVITLTILQKLIIGEFNDLITGVLVCLWLSCFSIMVHIFIKNFFAK